MEFNRRKTMLVLICFGVLFVSPFIKSALISGQNLGVQPAWATEQGAKAAHAVEEHHGAPFIYYVDWLLLIITLALVWFKVKPQLKKTADEAGEHHAEAGHADEHPAAPTGAGIPIFLIGLVVFIFLTESLSAVAHYHEPVGAGLVHVLVELSAGVLLMLYGLSFMHEH